MSNPNPIELSDLFFDIDIANAASNKNPNIVTADYKIISHKNKNEFLGIKKAVEVSYAQKEAFVFTHEQAYNFGEHLSKAVFGCPPNLYKFYTDQKDKHWACFFFEIESAFVESFLNRIIEPQKYFEIESAFVESFLNRIIEPQKYTERKEYLTKAIFRKENDYRLQDIYIPKNISSVFKHFTFLVGVFNSYAFTEDLKFYFIISDPDAASDSDLSLFTITFFNFNKKQKIDILKNNAVERSNKIKEILSKDALQSFYADIFKFIKLYLQAKSKAMKLDSKNDNYVFASVALDVYNKNRSVTSFENDERLSKSISELKDKAESYYQKYCKDRNINFADTINFIINTNLFELKNRQELPKSVIEDALTIKEAYQNMLRRFPKLEGNILTEYLEDQVQSRFSLGI